MADVTLTYKGATIGELSESGNKTIETAGKYCEADILLEYEKPQGGPEIVVPSGYTQLEYLQNDGKAFLNSGKVWASDSKIEMIYTLSKAQSTFAHPFGSGVVFAQFRPDVVLYLSPQYYAVKLNASNYKGSYSFPLCRLIKHTIIPSEYIVTDIENNFSQSIVYFSSPTVSENDQQIGIFCRISNGERNFPADGMRLYSWKFYSGNVLNQHLVPARRNSDNVLGCYDVVNDVFLTDQSTDGAFTGGEL